MSDFFNHREAAKEEGHNQLCLPLPAIVTYKDDSLKLIRLVTAPLLTICTSLQLSNANKAKFITQFQLEDAKKSAGQKLKERTTAIASGAQEGTDSTKSSRGNFRFAQLNFFSRNKSNVAKLNQ